TRVLRADDEAQRLVEDVSSVEGRLAFAVETDDEQAGLLEGPERSRQIRGPGHRSARRRACRGLPGTRGHPGAAPLGYDHTVGTERRRRAHDRAQVPGVGDAVDGDDQRGLAG